MYYVTFQDVERAMSDHNANLLARLGNFRDDPVPICLVLDVCGFSTALWALTRTDYRPVRSFSWRCAERVRHLLEDKRSVDALDAARDAARDGIPIPHEAWSMAFGASEAAISLCLTDSSFWAANAVRALCEDKPGSVMTFVATALACEPGSTSGVWHKTWNKVVREMEADFHEMFCNEEGV